VLPWLQQAHKGAHGNADLVAHFGGLSICCATAEPTKQVTSLSLDRNGISSSSRLIASAFCKASVNLAERTRAALNSFAKPVLSVRNVRMAATPFYRSIDFSSQ